ncbi:type II secretion system protein GspJ [Rhodopirellula sp.]|nr:type II secretion system protein GspJ [Rhodopirellula sp.]
MLQFVIQQRKNRIAFTLLELVLALSMSVVLMVLIGSTLQFYARDMNVRDMDIRQTQLAASIMQMIEDDLRSTLHPQPVDTAALEELLAATSGADTGGSNAAEGQDLSAAGIDSNLDSDLLLDESLMEVDLSTGVSVLTTPGLIGNQSQIQIDVSRLPRLEEYVALIDTNTSDLDDIPSDIKTVAYFVQSADVSGGVQDALANATAELGLETSLDSGGLVRRSLDRAATVEAANTGSLSLLNQTGDLLAPEVVGIEFSYWDGVTWLLEWSSDTYEELPLAISVSLTLKAEGQEESGVVSSDGLLGSARVFTHIVRLPLAKPIDQTDEEDLSEVGL